MGKKNYITLLKIFITLLVTVLVISVPFVSVFLYGLNTKHTYSKSYYAALVDKTNRLESIKTDKKIIIIGGSGVAFGFDSETLKKYYPDYDIQNFGLYADLGIKLMLDLSKEYVGRDDIVIIAPEMSSQTMSLFFNPTSFLKATEDRGDLFNKLEEENKKQVAGKYVSFLEEKSKITEDFDLVGVYQRKNFNQYGDISYFEEKDGEMVSMRTSNIMGLRYDINTPIYIKNDIIDNEFIDYINNYAEVLKKKGATVLYDYSPINKLAVVSTEEDKTIFVNELNKSLAFPIIGNVDDHIISYEYFYDSNFHMNDTGALYNTLLFVRDLKTYFGDYSSVEDFPEKPKREDNIYNETEEDVENAKYFTFEQNDENYFITGLTDEGVTKEELRISAFYEGTRVARLKRFEEANSVRNLIIPECQILFDDGFLASFPNIETVHILEKNPNNISIGLNFLMDTKKDVKIYVPRKSFESYVADYFWSHCSELLIGE